MATILRHGVVCRHGSLRRAASCTVHHQGLQLCIDPDTPAAMRERCSFPPRLGRFENKSVQVGKEAGRSAGTVATVVVVVVDSCHM